MAGKKPKSLKKIKTGLLSRSLSLAKLTVSTGAGLTAQKVKGILRNKLEKDQAWLGFLQSQALVLTQEVGELKGSLLKAGQMLSVLGEHFLPPEVNVILKAMQNDSQPLEWEQIEKVLKKQLTPEALSELDIEKESLASASLSQVHRAKVKSTGQLIVLKVQYPGVDKAIDSDIKALKKFLSLLKVFPSEVVLDPVLAEIKTMLLQEIDYENEVLLMETYRDHLKNDPRFVIPKVLKKYSGKKLIALSFERGLKADDPLIQSLPQERRNRLASNFLDLYLKELFIWHFIQTDPHLGNYRVRINPTGQDEIVLFDFGATRKFSPIFIEHYARLIKSCIERTDDFEQICIDFEFLKKGDPPELVELFKKLCFLTVEPFFEGVYDWKNTDLPKRISETAFHMMRKHPLRTPPKEFVFLNRKTAGVFVFMSVLGAKIESRNSLLKYLNKPNVSK